MHEGYTLEMQRKDEEARGWDSTTCSATVYPTAEIVYFRVPADLRTIVAGDSYVANSLILEYEILEAVRVTGAADCINRLQGKWGTQVRPPDGSALQAIKRCIKEDFGWELPWTPFAGLYGPLIHKATITLEGYNLHLEVRDEQMERTPFEAKVFTTFIDHDLPEPKGRHEKATKNLRWVKLRELIVTQGRNPDYLYWTMIWMAARRLRSPEPGINMLVEPFPPGTYTLDLRH